jgi:hypothetical protein
MGRAGRSRTSGTPMSQKSDPSPSAQTGRRGEAARARTCVWKPRLAGETSAQEPDGEGVRTPEPFGRTEARSTVLVIDGMTVEQPVCSPCVHWPRLREQLLAGRYQPQPVRRWQSRSLAGASSASRGPRPVHPADLCCRSCSRCSTQPFRMQVRPPAPAGTRTTRWFVHKPTCRKAAAWWVDNRPGEVLRPGQPRHPDGRAGQADRGPSGAAADPPLPQCGVLANGSSGMRERRKACSRPLLAVALHIALPNDLFSKLGVPKLTG